MNISASELFDRLYEVTVSATEPAAVHNRQLHELLVLTCQAGVATTGQAFGNLFSQVDYLCKSRGVGTNDRKAIHTLRRHSNHDEPLSREDFLYDVRALCLFVSAVFGEAVPDKLVRLIPAINRPSDGSAHVDVHYVRCIVNRWDDTSVTATMEQDSEQETISIDYSDFDYLRPILTEGMQLNLLDCTLTAGDSLTDGAVLKPSLIVVEPDFLIDISSIATCFQDFGHHPLLYTVNRMKPRANTQAMLLGTFAGAALDDMINDDDFSLNRTIGHCFRRSALEYSTCPDFDSNKFLADARQQSDHLRETVKVLFDKDYEREKAVLEPSFVCERLGLQGRVDLMTTDMRLLVEQKSGRNINVERGLPNSFGSYQLEPHYVQLLLYYGVLRQNFRLGYDKVDIRLLYSKYEPARGLMVVAFYQKLFREAMKLRNQIVATELFIAKNGFGRIIDRITPEVLNTNGLASTFYQRYLLPQLLAVTQPLQQMTPLERLYYCRMMTFVFREQRASRLGARQGIGHCAADLWNMPLSEKRETGNIFVGLTIEERKSSPYSNGIDLVTLAVPDQGDTFLPNFRRGDRVFLYAYDETPDARNTLLYSGTLTEITTDRLVVCLSNPWNKYQFAATNSRFAIEHDTMDVSAGSSVRGLHEFITAPRRRRDLLLAQRAPERDESRALSRSYHPHYDEVVRRAMQARDYFLLVGPPGTGKTSMALQFLVREELTSPQAALLLMAYTHRAVDEICGMLLDHEIPFLRLGSEHSCDMRFKPFLLDSLVGAQPQLDAVRQQLMAVRVVVSTTSTLASRPFLFSLKHFSLAIVDEASQILEPSIIGILASHRLCGVSEQANIDRFILIGDHKQLPAVVQQTEEDARVDEQPLRDICLTDCRQSLFERLIRTERAAGRTAFIDVLSRYGRMHPELASFPSTMFYGREQLQPVPLKHQQEENIYPFSTLIASPSGEVGEDFSTLKHHRLLFIPSTFCRQPDVSDKVNADEAHTAARLLISIKTMSGDSFDPTKTVGVIVPYRNQIAMIRHELARLLPAGEEDAFSNVSIDTVERYQGSQRDIIIYCFTVQNRYQLDFLTSNCFTDDDGTMVDRKLNVALTRARKQNIIIGNRAILSTNPLFKSLIDYCERQQQLP